MKKQNLGEQDLFSVKKKEILRERARLLACKDEIPAVPDTSMNGLSILLSEETYLLDSNYIVEVLPLNEITPLPCTPSFILGIINVHGRILAVINLKTFLGLPEKGITNLNRVIVVKHEAVEVGLLADEVLNHQIVSIDRLQKGLPVFSEIQQEFISGITTKGEIIFNLKNFLSSNKIIIKEDV